MRILMIFGFIVASMAITGQSAIKSPSNVTIWVLEDGTQEQFQKVTEPLLKKELEDCKFCQIKNLSPYDAEGKFQSEKIQKVLIDIPKEPSILYVGWNRALETTNDQILIDALKDLAKSGIIIVGSAGFASEDLPISALSRTVLGKVGDVVIIGELKERETLVQKSHFGPEMLTAVQPPKEFLNSGKAPLFFVTRLAQNFGQRNPHQWLEHFRMTKAKSRKIWPGIGDFFRN